MLRLVDSFGAEDTISIEYELAVAKPLTSRRTLWYSPSSRCRPSTLLYSSSLLALSHSSRSRSIRPDLPPDAVANPSAG
jgi:hypothetical protein